MKIRSTRTRLIESGHDLALKIGLNHVKNRNVTEAASVYYSSVVHHFGGIDALRAAILAHGVAKGTMVDAEKPPAVRMSPADRKAGILAEAIKQASADGMHAITRVSVANALGITDGLISRYFGSVKGLREAVLFEGIKTNNPDIVADAIELEMSTAHVPPELLTQAQALLAP